MKRSKEELQQIRRDILDIFDAYQLNFQDATECLFNILISVARAVNLEKAEFLNFLISLNTCYIDVYNKENKGTADE
jgi:hypothetical protein